MSIFEKLVGIGVIIVAMYIIVKIAKVIIPFILKWTARLILKLLMLLLKIANILIRLIFVIGFIALIAFLIKEVNFEVFVWKEFLIAVVPKFLIAGFTGMVYEAYDLYYEELTAFMQTTYVHLIDKFF